ncbi:MAG: glycosyltransferase family 2 protein, partial [Bacteroidia bacterium]|nr:glycosyltransferase family 2 protein [Bacteroidia bacterium]
MFSVVIPLYNKEAFISTTIRSVLDQSFQDFELLVIDDGSTDDSHKIVQEFNDSRIRLKSIKNSGVSVARNFGVEKSKYDWIAFLDADDYWTSGFLETLW